MVWLRSLVFNVLFDAWCAVVFLACIPLLVLPRPAIFAAARLWVRVSLAMLARICGLRHEVRGLSNLPEGPCIVASKHQSAWDTLIFATFIDGPSFVFKRELLWIPFLGLHLLKGGSIPVERSGGITALRKLIRKARQVVEQGRKIVIFPEGTRVEPGERRPYHPGAAALYAQLRIPVVPVAVNSGLFWGRRSFLKKPGCIVMEILEPIAPGMHRKEFIAELEGRINSGSDRLAAAPPNDPPTDP